MVEVYCLWFFTYSIIGWIYESILCSFIEKKAVNRGFLTGPYCPIYGFGALLDVICLSGITNWILVSFLGMILNCTLEYITSYAMEKLFHARWWDYSDKKININGRICLEGAIVFGLFCVLLIELVHPIISNEINSIPSLTRSTIVLILLGVYCIDNIVTILAIVNFDEKLQSLKDELEKKREVAIGKVKTYKDETVGMLNQYKEGAMEVLTQYKDEAIEIIKSKIPDSGIYNKFIEDLNIQHKRIIKAFPRMKSIKYNEILNEIKERLKK